MLRHIKLSVKLSEVKMLKDALSLYRNVCQNTTP
jgi:hypothetical protein